MRGRLRWMARSYRSARGAETEFPPFPRGGAKKPLMTHPVFDRGRWIAGPYRGVLFFETARRALVGVLLEGGPPAYVNGVTLPTDNLASTRGWTTPSRGWTSSATSSWLARQLACFTPSISLPAGGSSLCAPPGARLGRQYRLARMWRSRRRANSSCSRRRVDPGSYLTRRNRASVL